MNDSREGPKEHADTNQMRSNANLGQSLSTLKVPNISKVIQLKVGMKRIFEASSQSTNASQESAQAFQHSGLYMMQNVS